MTRLMMIRHAPTPWNRAGLLQGRTDVALDPAGEGWVATWRLPAEAADLLPVASPLARARRTAELLLGAPPPTDPRLAEMHYGAWEGQRLADLRARLGEAMTANEARGWDFTPPKGESPAMVLARLAPWLRERAGQEPGTLALCHNGIIRVVMARAAGWDFRGKPPAKLRDGTAHLFRLAPDGTPSVERLNIPLTDSPKPEGPAS